ncbi:trypsin alpha-3 [Drosophila ficusphila]|uniref:trypsin alpha-3 n=1 Tax=Drosophila ficusphila TaxID=30025 RepID=UPI0007E782E7|nr:trypsin alpha-3 [Drosophila ficusphila]
MFSVGLLWSLVVLVVFTTATPTPAEEGRIVGGEVTTIREFPYQVSVQLHGEHICGGAVIGDHFVLTAAHCFEVLFPTEDYSVRVGSGEHATGGHLLSLRQVITHGGYNPQSHDNDLALLILNARLNFTEHLQPVPRATLVEPPTMDTRLVVSGWGLQAEESGTGSAEIGGGVSPTLRFVDVDLVESDQCRRAYRQVLPITQRMICAARPGRDSCQGDSGGPLVGIPAQGGPARLYGIVSWGLGCANPKYPGVYTNVAAFRNWIDAQVGAWGWNGLLAAWSGVQ